MQARAEKTPLLPYDVDEAIALNQQRGDLGTMFESEEDLKGSSVANFGAP